MPVSSLKGACVSCPYKKKFDFFLNETHPLVSTNAQRHDAEHVWTLKGEFRSKKSRIFFDPIRTGFTRPFKGWKKECRNVTIFSMGQSLPQTAAAAWIKQQLRRSAQQLFGPCSALRRSCCLIHAAADWATQQLLYETRTDPLTHGKVFKSHFEPRLRKWDREGRGFL